MAEQARPPADNRFAASWLALRESHDASARSAELAAAFCVAVAGSGSPEPMLIDLATGRGANPAYLRPRLPVNARWILADHDPELLADAVARLAPGEAEQRAMDLRTELETIDFGACDGVTASALLDLVSLDWLERLAVRCAQASVPVLLSLIYDGTMAWRPADPFDGSVLSAFNRHQRTDKGFGPALGPAAATEATTVFAARGFKVDRRASPWQISSDDPEMLNTLIEGIAEACIEMIPAKRTQTESWRRNRRHHCSEGTLELRVGHVDVLALPADF